jgi:hypothetical protein
MCFDTVNESIDMKANRRRFLAYLKAKEMAIKDKNDSLSQIVPRAPTGSVT